MPLSFPIKSSRTSHHRLMHNFHISLATNQTCQNCMLFKFEITNWSLHHHGYLSVFCHRKKKKKKNSLHDVAEWKFLAFQVPGLPIVSKKIIVIPSTNILWTNPYHLSITFNFPFPFLVFLYPKPENYSMISLVEYNMNDTPQLQKHPYCFFFFLKNPIPTRSNFCLSMLS